MLVPYAIPDRDCGGASQGGASDIAACDAWIREFARWLGAGPVIVIARTGPPPAAPRSGTRSAGGAGRRGWPAPTGRPGPRVAEERFLGAGGRRRGPRGGGGSGRAVVRRSSCPASVGPAAAPIAKTAEATAGICRRSSVPMNLRPVGAMPSLWLPGSAHGADR
ncbi:hypothetical protein [Streptomyces sp. ISL-111]|uniref:hypothetical protein n=2 Tax=unclassified Streptomyces TaxID=2593676 RepID=UPI0035ABF708